MIRPRRRGFTLIELLVVIAIIGVLISLLLPAVQASREAARRSQCLNNLMQIGIALKGYEDAFEALPAGVINPTGPIANTPTGYHFGWVTQILPYLDARPVYRHLNFNAGIYQAENSTARAVTLSVLICPSTPTTPRTPPAGPSAAPGLEPEFSDYAACHHDREAPIDANNNGVFYLNSRTRYEDITDGSSHTIFVGEKRRDDVELGWASGTRATLRNMGWTINATPTKSATPRPGDPEAAEPAADDVQGGGRPGAEAPKDHVGGFGGSHPGGANFCFADGSVRFLRTTVKAKILALLANRADGDLLDGDQF